MATEMTAMTCCVCHILYSIPKIMYQKSQERKAGHGWYCPNGHRLIACKDDESEEIKTLRRNLAYQTARADGYLESLRCLQRSNAALRGVITKLKRRLKK
jgi:hypothetical protein